MRQGARTPNRFSDALRAVLRMAPGGACTVPYGRLRLRAERAPEPGVRFRLRPVRAETSVPVVTVYEPAAVRPAGYPPELPFEPGLPVLVASPDGEAEDAAPRHWAAWEGAYDAAHLVERLSRASEADGWHRVEAAADDDHPPRSVLTRGGVQRAIATAPTSGPPAVMLMDTGQG